jgi:ABC-type glycerol-3-phosphate transport system substrate-binding protein
MSHEGGHIMRRRAIVVAVCLILTPLAAKGADIVVWWEKGQAAEEDKAVREIIAAFEQKTGKQVELVLGVQEELLADLVAALEAGRHTPDFVFTVVDISYYERWAYEGRLVDLTDVIGHYSGLFAREALDSQTVVDGTFMSGKACWSVPVSRSRTSRKSGMPSGPSGATRSSRRYARLWAATTSGALACPCRLPRSTPRTGSGSS